MVKLGLILSFLSESPTWIFAFATTIKISVPACCLWMEISFSSVLEIKNSSEERGEEAYLPQAFVSMLAERRDVASSSNATALS